MILIFTSLPRSITASKSFPRKPSHSFDWDNLFSVITPFTNVKAPLPNQLPPGEFQSDIFFPVALLKENFCQTQLVINV